MRTWVASADAARWLQRTAGQTGVLAYRYDHIESFNAPQGTIKSALHLGHATAKHTVRGTRMLQQGIANRRLAASAAAGGCLISHGPYMSSRVVIAFAQPWPSSCGVH